MHTKMTSKFTDGRNPKTFEVGLSASDKIRPPFMESGMLSKSKVNGSGLKNPLKKAFPLAPSKFL
jgi:hypothetical protein